MTLPHEDPRPPSDGTLESINLAAKFGLELCSLAAFGYWGSTVGQGMTSVLLAIATPATAAGLWGLLAAPRATRRLATRWRLPFEMTVLALACLALADAGEPIAAAGLGAAMATNAALLTRFGQWAQ